MGPEVTRGRGAPTRPVGETPAASCWQASVGLLGTAPGLSPSLCLAWEAWACGWELWRGAGLGWAHAASLGPGLGLVRAGLPNIARGEGHQGSPRVTRGRQVLLCSQASSITTRTCGGSSGDVLSDSPTSVLTSLGRAPCGLSPGRGSGHSPGPGLSPPLESLPAVSQAHAPARFRCVDGRAASRHAGPRMGSDGSVS